MDYSVEKNFILNEIRYAVSVFGKNKDFIKEQKSEHDLVTDVDKNIEGYLKQAINRQFPADKIISEETLAFGQVDGRTWIIDPIDGTCNMARGISMYGVQCALADNGEIVLGVIVLPNVKEEYVAVKGCGAYLNGAKLKVNSEADINNAIVSFTDFPHKSRTNADREHRAMGRIYPQIAKVRMFGAGCHDFAYLAAGKTDACVANTDNLWDLCAGLIICREAGAIITDFEDKPYKFGSFGVILSATRELHSLIINAFRD